MLIGGFNNKGEKSVPIIYSSMELRSDEGGITNFEESHN